MPVALRRYASDFLKHSQKRIRESNKDIQFYIREVLEPELMARTVSFANEVFSKNGRFRKKVFDQKKRQFLNQTLARPMTDFSKYMERMFYRDMKDAFFTSRRMLVNELKVLHYPIEEIETKEDPKVQFSKIDFGEGSLSDELQTKFLEKRLAECENSPLMYNLAVENLQEDITYSLKNGYTYVIEEENEYYAWNVVDGAQLLYLKMVGEMSQILEQTGSIKIPLRSPKLNKDFLAFLNKQFIAGVDPTTRIVTFSQDHVNALRQMFLADIRQGLDPTFTKNKFLNRFFSNVTDKEMRRKLEFNTMRILRTSYGNAAALSTSMFALRNQHILGSLMRVANGRPCFPPFKEHYIESPSGNKYNISKVGIGDWIINGIGEVDRVIDVHKRWYEGDLVVIELSGGRILKPTLNHEFPVKRDDKIIVVEAKDILESDELLEGDELF